MALPTGPTILPFKSEKISFSLAYKSEAAPAAQVELACLCIGRDAQVLDFVQFNRRAALNSALKHSACSYLAPKDAVPGSDEAIHMYPFELSPQCEVLLLLASAPSNALLLGDLAASGRLQFRVHARELGAAAAAQLLDVDLVPLLLATPADTASSSSASGSQRTMLIAGVFTTPQGWTLSFDCTIFREDHWGLLLPQLRRLLRRWPALSAAAAAEQAGPKLKRQVVISSRPGADSTLEELSARLAAVQREAATPGSLAGGAQPSAAAAADGGNGGGGGPDSDAGGVVAEPAAEACAAGAAAGPAGSSSPDRLVLEVGWELYRPRVLLLGDEDEPPGEADDDEEPPVDFALSVYNLQGEELVTLNIDNPVYDGVTIEDEPAEDEEPQQEEEGDDEAAAVQAAEPSGGSSKGGAGSGGSNHGANADEDDDEAFVKEDDSGGGGDGNGGHPDDEQQEEESPEARAARIAAAAEAAAAAAQAAAANQRPLAERFPLKRRIQLSLSEVPPDARALLLTITCFGSAGFKNVKSLQARLLVAPQPPAAAAAPADGAAQEDGAEDDAAPPPRKAHKRQPEQVLAHVRFDSVQGADAHLTQLLVLKLYREYADSAFAVWAQQQAPSVAALLGGAAGVEAAAAAAAPGSPAAAAALEAVPSERAKAVLQGVLAAHRRLQDDLAARRAKAAEEGLEDELLDDEGDGEGGGYDLRLARGVWRLRVLSVSAGGSSPEELTDTVSSLLAYDGHVDASGLRHSAASKVAYPNRDTYFGPYAAPGVKAGIGLYVAGSGAAFIGQHGGPSGRRSGFGLMVLPDGGLYKGCFKEDRFDGQGAYLYPDSSLYTGGWRAGRKHGAGTYWDAAGGCLRGEWAAGKLRGNACYDQPSYHFEGRFAKGLPAGPCRFTCSSAFRSAGLPAAAGSFITDAQGPTLRGGGTYALPAGVAGGDADAAHGGEDEEQDEEAAEGEAALLPAWPKYEGLAYAAGAAGELCAAPDVAFPPPGAQMAAV